MAGTSGAHPGRGRPRGTTLPVLYGLPAVRHAAASARQVAPYRVCEPALRPTQTARVVVRLT